MDLSIITLIESTVPSNITFNSFGVAQNGLLYNFSKLRLSVTFRVMSINGIWYGALTVNGGSWGFSEPLTKQNTKCLSFEECTDNLWKSAFLYIERNKSGYTGEFLNFKVEIKKWFSLNSEKKYALFKEENFYG